MNHPRDAHAASTSDCQACNTWAVPGPGAKAPAMAQPGRGHAGQDTHDHDHDHDHGHDHGRDHSHGHDHDHDHDHAEVGIAALAAALALAVVAELVHFLAPESPVWRGLGMAVALLAIALSGLGVYKQGLAAIAKGRLNINALMAVAVTGAFLIGQWPEAAMVMALFSIAEAIEGRAVGRARNAIAGLLALAPEVATVRAAAGGWVAVPVEQVSLGAVVRVKPGERVPMDGTVRAGATSINQAPVTGESIPVDKGVGDAVFAGTINEAGSFEFEVTAVAAHSTLARIIHAVEQAQATRAPTQGFVDRFAAVYTPAVFALALALAVLSPFALGWSWTTAVYKALVLLVIACPCALVISTPVSIVSVLAAAARRGILVKGGIYLEQARKLRVVALDKTGTVTEGKPSLVHWQALADAADPARIEALAHALAAHSDHPVSRAIAAGLGAGAIEVMDVTALPGRGVQGVVGGERIVLCNHRLIEERGQCSAALEATLLQHERAGRTVTLLASDEGVLALFAVADRIKAHAREAIDELHALGIRTVMLSGDNQATASAVAQEAGIDEARGNLLPTDKLTAIEALQRAHGPTAMTGDGINDAPALARAQIGIAMGGVGTDTAMEAADVVVMNDDLRRIPELVRLSQRTNTVLWQNITLALGIKAVFFVLAVFGSATMWMAVFADMGASLLVVGNGLRLLRTSTRA
ncbi:MAG: heavy metal translocating P-type ATPase [Rubrivivax sp.]|nr:heavy metal translocating P-type ATPase [Rubrivivax sp.]